LLLKHLHIKETITLRHIHISRNYVSKKDVFRAESIKQDGKTARRQDGKGQATTPQVLPTILKAAEKAQSLDQCSSKEHEELKDRGS
jgi:hypothetical protein